MVIKINFNFEEWNKYITKLIQYSKERNLSKDNKQQFKEVEKFVVDNDKLINILQDIKEIAQGYEDTYNQECKQLCCTEILEKIKEL